MSILVWVMIAIALWHFTIWLPDRWVGGIQGALLAVLLGGLISGFVINGFSVPAESDVNLLTALDAIPGVLIALGISWWRGSKIPE